MKKFNNIKVLVGLFLVFSLFTLANVSAMEKSNNLSQKEISCEKNNGTIYLLDLNVPEYSKYGYSKEIVDQLKNIDVKMVDFVKTNFAKYDFKNEGIQFNGKREDIFKFYSIMYKSFVNSVEQLKKYSVYEPKNIEYVSIAKDYSTAYLKLNYCDLSEDENFESCGVNPCLERYACEVLIREIILFYIKTFKETGNLK